MPCGTVAAGSLAGIGAGSTHSSRSWLPSGSVIRANRGAPPEPGAVKANCVVPYGVVMALTSELTS